MTERKEKVHTLQMVRQIVEDSSDNNESSEAIQVSTTKGREIFETT